MPPNTSKDCVVNHETDIHRNEIFQEPPKENDKPRKLKVKKGYVLYFLYVHGAGLYGLYLMVTGAAKWETLVYTIFMHYVSLVGVTAGTHRLWAHRAYKATLPLQVALAAMTAVAFQFSAITWARDHRAHHKYSDTDADPHNSSRGLFFSHIGWIMMEKHPEVKRRGAAIDLSDLYDNPVLRFQHDYYNVIAGLACFIIPPLIPLLWGDLFWVSWHLNFTRYMTTLHITFLTNSIAHKWGNRPYDKNIAPTQNMVVVLSALGEGFHNYHHTFPFDYRTSEIGNNILNPTTLFIDLFARIGWAYDLKTASAALVRDRATRTGDGTSSRPKSTKSF